MITVKPLPPLLVLVSFFGSGAFAQTPERAGSITGIVTDSDGAVIPGATVMVKNIETQIVQLGTTGKSGDFHVEALPPGKYTVDAWTRYFERSSQPGIILTPGSTKKVRFQLDLCHMSHLDAQKQNFKTRTDVEAGSDFEKELEAISKPSVTRS